MAFQIWSIILEYQFLAAVMRSLPWTSGNLTVAQVTQPQFELTRK